MLVGPYGTFTKGDSMTNRLEKEQKNIGIVKVAMVIGAILCLGFAYMMFNMVGGF
jgi:hypothetical protein